MASSMTFEKFLASRRNPVSITRTVRNPHQYADEFLEELDQHLQTVEDWINGDIDEEQMREAMEFFAEHFGASYQATPRRAVFRGQLKKVFDGSPRSYSYDPKIAEKFAQTFFANGFIIERIVCFECPDRAAFRGSLDLGKLLKRYMGHKYGFENEVVLYNTPPKGDAEVYAA